MSRHSARYGCDYGTILLSRPGQKYTQDISWNAPAQASQAATLFAEHQADEVLAYREQAAVVAIEQATEARRQHLSFREWEKVEEGDGKTNEEVTVTKDRLDNIATVLEAKAKTARDAVRRPPVVVDRPLAGRNNPSGKNKKVGDHSGGLSPQKFPLVFASTSPISVSIGGGGGGIGKLRSDSQRKHHSRPTYRCEVDALPGRVVVGEAIAIYDFASLYRDFSDWWSLLGPRKNLVICPKEGGVIGSRITALQLHWRQLWFLEDGKDLLTPLAWTKYQQQQLSHQQHQQEQQQRRQHHQSGGGGMVKNMVKKTPHQESHIGQDSVDTTFETFESFPENTKQNVEQEQPIIVNRVQEDRSDQYENGFTKSSVSGFKKVTSSRTGEKSHEEFAKAQWRRRHRRLRESSSSSSFGVRSLDAKSDIHDEESLLSPNLIMRNINSFANAPSTNDDVIYEKYHQEEERKEVERIQKETIERIKKEKELKETENREKIEKEKEKEKELDQFDVSKHFDKGRELATASYKKTPPNTGFNNTLWRDFIVNHFHRELLVPTNTDYWLNVMFPNASKASPPTSPLLKKTSALAFIHIPKTVSEPRRMIIK